MKLAELANGTESIFCMTHADFDGISSAALLMRYMRMGPDHVVFGYPQVQDLKPAMESLLSMHPKNSLVIFTDVSVNDDAVQYIISSLASLRRSGNRIAWIDHHPWSEKAVSAMKRACDLLVCGEGNTCAAERVIEELGTDDDYAMKVKALAHITDFNLTPPKGQEDLILDMVRAITLFKGREGKDAPLRKIAELVSRDDMRNGFIVDAAREYVKASELEISKLRHDCASYEVNGYKIGIGYARDIQSTQACAIIEEQLNTEIEVFINLNGYILNMRSRKGIDCSALASTLGGGGHPQAAAAKLGIKSDSEVGEGISRILKAAEAVLPRRA